jgi:hypothetical protein
MIFPTEIIEQIVLETQELRIADIFKKYISKYVYDKMEKNILIFGDVQSGKTKEIINYIKKEKDEYKVLVLQNSLLVLKQYISRFKSENIKFQIISKNTKEIKEKLIIIINNAHRYQYFQHFNLKKYILMIDEADMCINSCPLEGYKNVHITATPYNFKSKKTIHYDREITVQKSKNYYDFNRLTMIINDDVTDIVRNFLTTNNGMMLINRYNTVLEMNLCALNLSARFHSTPIIVLSSQKTYYLNFERVQLKQKDSVSNIIDSFKDHKHIIFIANRLANRGVSFVSSDYKRHLTHQITKVKSNLANYIQSVRLLGVYEDNPNLSLYITSDCPQMINKHLRSYF